MTKFNVEQFSKQFLELRKVEVQRIFSAGSTARLQTLVQAAVQHALNDVAGDLLPGSSVSTRELREFLNRRFAHYPSESRNMLIDRVMGRVRNSGNLPAALARAAETVVVNEALCELAEAGRRNNE